MFLPADDWLAPGYLDAAVRVMEANPSAGVVYGRSYSVDLSTGALSKRFSPCRKRGLMREDFLTPSFFSNFIPDISLYRSEALNNVQDPGSWFPTGGIHSVLANYDVFFTDDDQCYSGKSPSQVSKSWAQSGQYYTHLMLGTSGASAHCRDMADWIVWYLSVGHFHSNRPLLDLLDDLKSGHPYVRVAAQKSAIDVQLRLALLLVDDLLLESGKNQFRKNGNLGNVQNLIDLVRTFSTDQLESFRSALERRGIKPFV
jgi:hypothetical protein